MTALVINMTALSLYKFVDGNNIPVCRLKIKFVCFVHLSVLRSFSLLALSGGNRRTANVRSKGFSNLFILSKQDFENAMSDYPEAHKILKRKAKYVFE